MSHDQVVARDFEVLSKSLNEDLIITNNKIIITFYCRSIKKTLNAFIATRLINMLKHTFYHYFRR